MAYAIEEVTIKAGNSPQDMAKITALWHDIAQGKLAILLDSNGKARENITPIACYHTYTSINPFAFSLTVKAVPEEFYKNLEVDTKKGFFKKYIESDVHGNVSTAIRLAWEKVWNDHNAGFIKRTFIRDYEASIPVEFSADGKAYCVLYIAVQPQPAATDVLQ